MRFATLVLAPLISLSAQTFPDAAGLIRQRTHALEKYRSYEYTEETTTEAAIPGVPFGMPAMTTLHQALNPGKSRMEMKAGNMAAMTMVSDGQYMWMYSPMLKKYTKMAVSGEGSKDLLAGMGMSHLPDEALFTANAKVIRSEILDFNGKPHDCWVVESRVDRLPGAPQFGVAMQDVVYTFWIDKSLGLDLQTTMSGKADLPGQPAVETRTKTVKRSLKLNPDLPDSLFVFTPPEDAKETDELFPGMPGSARKPSASQVTAPSTASPQAFIPNLSPLERIEPVYPDAARGKDAHGMVRLLLTIDTQGRVTTVEALSGHELLRPAAIDAVKAWRFLPVTRNGKPVDAYTDATVYFMDRSKPPKNIDKMAFVAEEVAAVQRIMELQAKFPRSPEQLLADAERHAGANAQQRDAALPQLAKAALDAGALDKAWKYAEEMLQSATDPQDWNYGNAIHDGNMVLGMVALRQGNMELAKQYLIKAGRTPGSPQLNSFGPDLRLAQELAKKGERETVLEYLSLCRVFWKMGGDRLDAMIAAVRGGRSL